MREQNAIRRLLSGALLLVFLVEWLSPLSQLSSWTNVYTIQPILITIIGVLAVDVLRMAPIWTWTVKLLLITASVAAMFHGATILQLGWWMDFVFIVIQDFLCILTGQWQAISGEGRTLLFIGSWSTVICWLYAVILYQRMALIVTLLTTVYLLTLQLWFDIDTTVGIVFIIIAGMSLHGLSVLPVLEHKFGLTHSRPGWPMSWLISSIVFVTLTVGCGLAASLGQERASLKLPSMESMNWKSLEAFSPFSFANNSHNSTARIKPIQKSGYSMKDTVLGGSVKSDDSIAFLANTELPHAYWRGESKAIYDGRGWSNLTNDLFGYEIGAELPDVLGATANETQSGHDRTTYIQEVFPFPDYPHNDHATLLLSSGSIRRVEDVDLKEGASSQVGPVILDRIEGKYVLQDRASSTLTAYLLQSSNPINADIAKTVGASEKPIPTAISSIYTQLPDELPVRIMQLAQHITDKYNSTWEKANAIEQFLGEHYSYTLTPKHPVEEGDFVDQFLFELREGYCDYFSTAMTIMLRTVGIPARWVKGFAPGEMVNVEENSFLQESALRLQAAQVVTYPVMVRNSNAHSWVEVYVSGIGWTAFDPTPQSLIAVSQRSSNADPVTFIEDADSEFLYTLMLDTLSFITDKRTLRALQWIAMMFIGVQFVRILFRSKHIRRWLWAIHIRLLLFKYAAGMGTRHAEKQLLRRMLTQTFIRYEQGISQGETLRESVARGYFPAEVVVPLTELISMYESACYGPDLRKRISYRSIVNSWSLLR